MNLKTPILLTSILLLSSCKVGRFFIYNFADITDHKKFPKRELKASDRPFRFTETQLDLHPQQLKYKDEYVDYEWGLAKNKTVAFLVIRNDSILYENYFNDYEESSIVASFSMAKSVTSLLIGCAIDDGLIESVNDPVSKYIPEMSENGFDRVTLKHVLQMTSGLDYNEGYYNPFGEVATFYYGTKLEKSVLKLGLKNPPGNSFEYVSGNTQILGLVLDRVLKDKTITAYLEEKIWIPLGMEYDASWSIDRKKDGLEKTFCCINARARDWAKIGRLYMNKGQWEGKQIVSADWVEQSLKQDQSEGSAWYYQYQWWLPTKNGDFMAQGILGQYTYVNPDKNLIIVRLGSNYGDINWWNFLVYLGKTYY